ncbi:DUF5627 domain-containing protein [uncultured Draconibacterium sp.]|uniref:DUF5627 domain-containing protein n=1 Tax=uncultured Draconibacterium sp. TaxID=1573823 RepID=UPI0029C7C514|nr:DUF5627 domain-containing protein [uncultured Draconibacterium sp.]
MKKYLILIAFAVALFSCENQENEFEDYDFQTVYFPIQYPARTLALGESRSDNTIDLEHAFSIGASVGGMYENTIERTVNIRLAPELVDGASVNGSPLKVLPSNYYEPMEFNTITIPAGSFNGKIRVNLTDAFFADTLSTEVNYVIPLVIEPSTQDSVLAGMPLPEIGSSADRRVNSDWMPGFEPKDYTLFAVKYINPYHGMFLHSGVDETLDDSGNVVETFTYKADYVEQDLLTLLSTKSMTTCFMDRLGGQNQGDNFKVELTFNESGNITITSATGDDTVTGTGTFVTADDPNAVVWGDRGHMTINIDYYYTVSGVTHHAMDQLVYRDNNLQYEEFSISLD